MTIVARFYPNGEFSHGVDTSRARKERRERQRRDELTEEFLPNTKECRDRYLQWKAENADINLCIPGQSYVNREGNQIWVYTGDDQEGNHLYDVVCADGTDVSGVQMNQPIGRLIGHGNLTPLVHQMHECSPQPQEPVQGHESSRKRLESMTRNMARNIRQATYLLDVQDGKDLLSFLTLTLPNLSTDDLALCCERWDYMVDQFLKWLRKRSQKLNIPFRYVYCTEIQQKRLENRHEYAPHLHICFRGRYAKKSPWMVTPKQIRKAWADIISCVVHHRQFDNRALENIQRVKKSVSRYLSKYLTKGKCSLPSEGRGVVADKLHTQWGGMARCLSRAVRSCTIRLSSSGSNGGLAVCIIQNMERLVNAGLVRYYKPGEIIIRTDSIEAMERVLKVGCGCLQYPTYQGGLSQVIGFIYSNGYGREADRSIERVVISIRK